MSPLGIYLYFPAPESNLHRATCTESVAQSHLHRANLRRATWTEPFAQSNLHGANCVEASSLEIVWVWSGHGGLGASSAGIVWVRIVCIESLVHSLGVKGWVA